MRHRTGAVWLAALGLLWGGVAGPPGAGADPCRVDLGAPQQVIDGFGGSSAWSGALDDDAMDALFGTGPGQAGLTLLRVRIDPNRNWADEASNARKAHARGAKVLGTPWTPPAEMKTNGKPVGGELKPDQYGAYATFLHDAVTALGLDVCSVQNEPDIKVDYESCFWDGAQIARFLRDDAPAIGVPVAAPESYHFDDALLAPTLADAAAASHVAVVAGHIYGAGLRPHPAAAGKPVWMTEHYVNGANPDVSCADGKEIAQCLDAGMSAYIWWFLASQGCRVLDHDRLLRNGAVLGQFSRFLRPGDRRVAATETPTPGVWVTAGTGVGGKVVIVAVNTGVGSVRQSFTVAGPGASRLRRVAVTQTAAAALLTPLGALPVRSGGFAASLPGQSVTTFVGHVP